MSPVASLRDQIADQVAQTIRSMQGWSAERRDFNTALRFTGRKAIVNITGETKRQPDQLHYECTLTIAVAVFCNREDADQVIDGGLEVRYLDRSIADVERAIAQTAWPDSLARPTVTGWQMTEPEPLNVLQAVIALEVLYQHNADNPDVYEPAYPEP